jgi:hypothetical protein
VWLLQVCFLGNIVQTFAGSIHLGRRRHDSGAIHHEAMDEKAKTRPVFVESNLEDETLLKFCDFEVQ